MSIDFPHPKQRRTGFSLLELVAGLVLIAVVAGLAAYGGSAVVDRTRERAAVITLTTAIVEGQRVASRRDLQPGDDHLRQFPVTSAELAGAMSASGLEFTTGQSQGQNSISVKVLDGVTAIYAVRGGSICLVVADRLEGKAGWARTAGPCDATELSDPGNGWSEDPTAPTELDEEL
jgi:prepilin-type N-terminal cleavage/methylation domain-containing protein